MRAQSRLKSATDGLRNQSERSFRQTKPTVSSDGEAVSLDTIGIKPVNHVELKKVE